MALSPSSGSDSQHLPVSAYLSLGGLHGDRASHSRPQGPDERVRVGCTVSWQRLKIKRFNGLYRYTKLSFSSFAPNLNPTSSLCTFQKVCRLEMYLQSKSSLLVPLRREGNTIWAGGRQQKVSSHSSNPGYLIWFQPQAWGGWRAHKIRKWVRNGRRTRCTWGAGQR